MCVCVVVGGGRRRCVGAGVVGVGDVVVGVCGGCDGGGGGGGGP